jgi:hypothetical protein
MATTRRVLERAPRDKGAWMSHAKSLASGHLLEQTDVKRDVPVPSTLPAHCGRRVVGIGLATGGWALLRGMQREWEVQPGR